MALLRAALFVAVVASLLTTTQASLRIRSPTKTHDAQPEEIVPNNDGNVVTSMDAGDDAEDQDSKVNVTKPFSALVAEEGESDDHDDVAEDEEGVDLVPDVDEVQDDEEAEQGMPIEEDSQPKAKPVSAVVHKSEVEETDKEEEEEEENKEDEPVEEGMQKVDPNDDSEKTGVYNVMTGQVEKQDASLAQVAKKTKFDDEDLDEDDNQLVNGEDDSDDAQEGDEEEDTESDDASDEGLDEDANGEDESEQEEESMDDDEEEVPADVHTDDDDE